MFQAQWRSQTLVVEEAICMGLMGRGGGESMQIFVLSYLSHVKFLGLGGANAPIAPPPWLRHCSSLFSSTRTYYE